VPQVVDCLEHRDESVHGEIEGGIKHSEQSLANRVEPRDDFSYEFITSLQCSVEELENGLARRINQRKDQVGNVIGGPVDHVRDGLSQ